MIKKMVKRYSHIGLSCHDTIPSKGDIVIGIYKMTKVVKWCKDVSKFIKCKSRASAA